jgi:hypothetical protein
MKFFEVRDKLNGQALARRHSAFLDGDQEIPQENLWSCNNPTRLYWFHSVNEPRLAINGELDVSGKSPAYSHGRNDQPAPGNRQRAFL